MSSDEIDSRLMHHDRGVDHALQRAKIWAKYAKDVLNYVEKRTAMQMDLSKNLTKLVQASRPQLQEEIFLPFQSIYCLALDQDLEMCALMQASCGLLQGCKVGRKQNRIKFRIVENKLNCVSLQTPLLKMN